MVMNIMLFLGACAAAVLAASTLAIVALCAARRAARETRATQTRLALAEGKVADLDAAMTLAGSQIEGLSQRVQQLAILQQRVDGPASRQAVREAIALTRNGARAEQLVRNCGVGEGEARLIQALHGRDGLTAGATDVH
jgi:hypothetical protein